MTPQKIPFLNVPRQNGTTFQEHKSLFSVEKGKGLPIGNLTSQFFANVYLNALDQFVKHRLKARFYLRYVDDFILLHQNKEQLVVWKEQIRETLGI
jgi:RNA-directed DNA polymerase